MPTVLLHLRGEWARTWASERQTGEDAAGRGPIGRTWGSPEPALFYPIDPLTAGPVSAEWGLPADSPTVTGNLGMFYRDGAGQTQPYTWAEFLEHLARRVRAADQPALVRAKYGVGFALQGGDMPGWAFDPEQVSTAAAFRHANGQEVLVPEAMVTGTLDRDEARRYKERLAELVSRGEDQPTAPCRRRRWRRCITWGCSTRRCKRPTPRIRRRSKPCTTSAGRSARTSRTIQSMPAG